jgi:hypothetical protein
MQLLFNAMQNMFEQLNKQSDEHFARMNKRVDKYFEQTNKHLEDCREKLRAVHESMEQSVQKLSNKIETATQEIRHIEINICGKKEIKVDDAEEQPKINDKSQIEISASVQDQQPVTENRETKETETSAVEFSGRRGERDAPNERGIDVNMAEETNNKPRKSRVKSLTAAGARRKKKSKFSKKKWEVLEKTTPEKSTRAAFQAWMNQVCKKPREQTNNVRQQTTEMQRHVPWDPGGVVYKIHQKFSGIEVSVTHRSQYHSLVATRTPARG